MEVMINPTESKELDSFIKRGYFKNKNEAIQRAVNLLIFDIKKSSNVREEVVKSVRESRNSMWNECLKEAKGDEDQAWNIFHEKYCS